MPNDYIIRDGEVGKELFFLVEGIAKVIINPETIIMLKKGDYFGEIALIINSKRTADILTVDFTICETFKKVHYEELK